MPNAIEVRPKDWSEISVLYDDGVYSVIWGRFRRRPFKNMGVRYNVGDNPDGKGYPSFGKHPLWYVEPPFLVESILVGLQKTIASFGGEETSLTSHHAEYLRNIEVALRQAKQQAQDSFT